MDWRRKFENVEESGNKIKSGVGQNQQIALCRLVVKTEVSNHPRWSNYYSARLRFGSVAWKELYLR